MSDQKKKSKEPPPICANTPFKKRSAKPVGERKASHQIFHRTRGFILQLPVRRISREACLNVRVSALIPASHKASNQESLLNSLKDTQLYVRRPFHCPFRRSALPQPSVHQPTYTPTLLLNSRIHKSDHTHTPRHTYTHTHTHTHTNARQQARRALLLRSQ